MFSKLEEEIVSKFEEKLEQQMNRIDKLEGKFERQQIALTSFKGKLLCRMSDQLETKCDNNEQCSRRTSIPIH